MHERLKGFNQWHITFGMQLYQFDYVWLNDFDVYEMCVGYLGRMNSLLRLNRGLFIEWGSYSLL